MSKQNNESSNEKNQYFLFVANKDIYAITALEVIEIVEYQNITKVPMMSDFVSGVTNIRGNLIAVIDLLQRFGIKQTQIYDTTSLVILRKRHFNKELQIAVIIDQVYEVDDISAENIESTPDFGTRIDKYFIKNMAKYNDEYIAVLDIDTVLDIKELSILAKEKSSKDKG
ncbi:MAG: chemotaxis protein CheW [gamma proteobacterium symbiont of Taylorina sp.]|nr:chemotaxis protein CheW [gamma proteobacterium symbiont of Taylorina sp.]